MKQIGSLLVLVFTAASFACGPEAAIKVNGDKVTVPQWDALKRHHQVQNEKTEERFKSELVDAMLLAQEAKRLDLDEDPLTSAMLEQQQRQMLAVAFRDHVAGQIDEKAVRAHYDQNITAYTREVYELYQIVARFEDGDTAGEQAARVRIDRAYESLRTGVKFQSVAGELTDDLGARGNGGAVGKLSLLDIPEELRATVKQLQPRQFSMPVKSRFGLHILYLESEPDRVVQPYERISSKLRSELVQARVAQELSRLREKAKVKMP